MSVLRSRYFLDIDVELRNRFKAQAALHGKTMKEWVTEAIIARLEDEIDSTEGNFSLSKKRFSISLEEYLHSKHCH